MNVCIRVLEVEWSTARTRGRDEKARPRGLRQELPQVDTYEGKPQGEKSKTDCEVLQAYLSQQLPSRTSFS
jgi:hypothetical protein